MTCDKLFFTLKKQEFPPWSQHIPIVSTKCNFLGLIFSTIFFFFGSGQPLTLYGCTGGIACASQQLRERSKLCREGAEQSQAEYVCVILGQLVFCFVLDFVQKCMLTYILVFS